MKILYEFCTKCNLRLSHPLSKKTGLCKICRRKENKK